MTDSQWAVTLFSFTNELLEGSRTPDRLLASVLDDGVAQRVEIDGAQHFRSFPLLDLREVEATARVVQQHGGSVSVLGGGADLSPAPGRRIPDEVALAQLHAQVRSAALLGAEGVRLPFGTLGWPVLRRAADDARDAGVVLLEEVQGPETPEDRALLDRVEQLERSGETAVRLLLDTSTLMSDLPGTYIAALQANGVPEEVVVALRSALEHGHDRVAAVIVPQLVGGTLPPAAVSLLVTALTRFGRGAPAAWLPLVPWIAGVHLKYWDLELAARDLAGPVGAVLDALDQAGFSGTVCSEWGGHEWAAPGIGAAGQTREHRRLFEERDARASTVARP